MAGGGDPAEAVLLMTGASATPFRVRSAASDSGMVEGRIDGRFALGGGWSLGAGMDAGLGNGERHIAARATLGLQF